MPGVVTWVPGTGPGIGPIIPAPLHATGVDDELDYASRYVASEFASLADGTNLSSWHDYGTRALDLSPTASGTTRKQSDGGMPYLELATNASVSTNHLSRSAPTYEPDLTVAMVVRRVSNAMRYFRVGGAQAEIQADNSTRITRGANATLAATPTSWALVIVTLASLAWTQTINSSGSSGTLASGSTTPDNIAIGGNSGNTGTKTLHIAEFIVWNHALDATQRAAVRTAMRAHYPMLP